MPPPNLTGAKFRKLFKAGTSSPGTVTATGIDGTSKVHIETKNKKKMWDGKVTTLVSGTTWNATVDRTRDDASPSSDDTEDADEDVKGTETVTVTVTSNSQPSNPIDTDSDVVP